MKNLNIDNGINEDWTYNNLSPQRKAYVDAIVKYADLIHLDCDKEVFCRTELRAISTAYKKKRWIPNWITHDKERRAGVGEFYLPEVKEIFNADKANSTVVEPSVAPTDWSTDNDTHNEYEDELLAEEAMKNAV
jgi:hypothetical protein